MPKMTIQERIIRALLSDDTNVGGWEEVPSRSGKYRTFRSIDPIVCRRLMFVGKAGALRYGICASKSTSLERHPFRARCLAYEPTTTPIDLTTI